MPCINHSVSNMLLSVEYKGKEKDSIEEADRIAVSLHFDISTRLSDVYGGRHLFYYNGYSGINCNKIVEVMGSEIKDYQVRNVLLYIDRMCPDNNEFWKHHKDDNLLRLLFDQVMDGGY